MVRWVDGAELHRVQYSRPGELSSHIDTFPASQVRADTVDRRPVDDASATPPRSDSIAHPE